jgi:asparagine synthase (glutamine-hydrolysing)
MSGIIGIWNLDKRPLENGLLSKLSLTLAHRGPDGEELWTGGAMGLACQLMRVTPESRHETQPLVHPSGAVAVFDGRLDNRDELLRLLQGAWGVTPDSPDPALVLAAYDKFGNRCPEYLNGDFALAIFDPPQQQLLLARDAIGLRPLYYHRAGDTFLFASETKAILAHPRVSVRPNDGMVAELLTRNFSPYEGETFFSEVFSLLPGYLAILSPAGFSIRQYWDFDTKAKIRFRSFPEYVEAFRHHFETAVGRRLRSAYPLAISVSGGLDSSSIYCQVEKLRQLGQGPIPPLIGLTFSPGDGSPADELSYIEAIERCYGAEIERIPTGPLALSDDPENDVWNLEMPFLLHKTLHKLHHVAASRGARVLLTGYWGDEILSAPTYLVDLLRQLKFREFRQHFNAFKRLLEGVSYRFFHRIFLRDLILHHIPEPLLPWARNLKARVFPSGWNIQVKTAAMRQQALGRLLKKFPRKIFGSAHTKALYREMKMVYCNFQVELFSKLAARSGLELSNPFMDREVLSFQMGIPGNISCHQGVTKGLLRRAMSGVLPEAVRLREGKGNFTFLENQGMLGDFPRVLQCLQSGMAVGSGYVQAERLAEELEQLRDRLPYPNILAARQLQTLWGLEVWLQTFFGEPNYPGKIPNQ